MNPKVDQFLKNEGKWQSEMTALRALALSCGLEEEFKWYKPCYAINANNVVLIHGFKGYCALLFFKGAIMKDPEGILVQQTENVQAARQIRFTNLAQVVEMKATLKAYIEQAIAIEKSGLTVEMKKQAELQLPDEFVAKLDELPKLKAAFQALTPGRQKGYQLFFSSAKQSKTRESRIAKAIPNILQGKGLDD
jgi:uncharacterized protein YdeI (YjbR/CyaY-like superfamily)